MTPSRADVNSRDKWHVEALYSSWKEWEADFSRNAGDPKAAQLGASRWPSIIEYRGRLGESATTLKEALATILNTGRMIEKLYTYAHLRHDEEISHDTHKSNYNKILSTYIEFGQEAAWFEPELLTLSKETLDCYLQSTELAEYTFHIEKILHLREHTLSADKEALIALAGKALATPQQAFSALSDADFKFGVVLDGEGKEQELTHASYGLYLRKRDRILRKNALEKMNGQYRNYENTITELLSGQIQSHLFHARSHKYRSCLEAALLPKNIDTSVYHSLIKAVHNKLPLLHKYTRLRKQLLDVKELHTYDLYVPLVDEIDIKMDYAEAEKSVIASAAPLGEEYEATLKKGLSDDRWVDRYENLNKRSGAYSSGCYDSMPYILMNYKGVLRDVFTLAHEAGHSMHSDLSRKNQPYHYSSYPIFVAEVASTFNEELLMQHLLSTTTNPLHRAYLINEKIEDIRATLIRQTMFAEFELMLHEMAERGEPITPSRLREENEKLNTTYFGSDVVIDEGIHIEWARIPHFYYNFYVYQYATGISAALSLAKKVTEGGDSEREAYLNFLQGGCSQYPLDLLRSAGVDLNTPEPVETALDKFGTLVDELDGMLAPAQ